jgi:hypothetical protein
MSTIPSLNEFDAVDIIKERLHIPKDSWINEGYLWQDQSYTSCGSGFTVKLREATELDKAVFLLETELKERREVEEALREKQQLAYLKSKYEKKQKSPNSDYFDLNTRC